MPLGVRRRPDGTCWMSLVVAKDCGSFPDEPEAAPKAPEGSQDMSSSSSSKKFVEGFEGRMVSCETECDSLPDGAPGVPGRSG